MSTAAAMFDLTGKVALVTGGGSGIGFGIASGLARAGATIVIAARDATRGAAAVEQIEALGAAAHFVALDLRDPEACRAVIPAAVECCGKLDILVNNAGIGISKPPQDFTLDEWHAIFDINLTGAFLLCQAAYPEFLRRGGGKIINVGSTATVFGSAIAAPYSASKGGTGQLTKSLAAAWGPDNIQVNAILPGYIESDMTALIRAERPGFDATVTARTPARRLGRPEDCAGLAIFLASPASAFVTGTLISVDGGYASQI